MFTQEFFESKRFQELSTELQIVSMNMLDHTKDTAVLSDRCSHMRLMCEYRDMLGQVYMKLESPECDEVLSRLVGVDEHIEWLWRRYFPDVKFERPTGWRSYTSYFLDESLLEQLT